MSGNSELLSKVKNPHDANINDEVDKRVQPKGKFLFFSTCSPESLMEGVEVELDMSYDPSQCKKELMKVVENYVEDIKSMDLLIYLSCGIPFLGGTLGDLYNSKTLKVKKYIYGILTRQFPSNILEQKYPMLCNVTDDIHKRLISPICDSSIKGYCDMACLLGYLNNDGTKTEKLLNCSAATIRFPPLITTLNRVKERNDVTGFDIVTICSTFYTYFRYLIKSVIKAENVFEYALRCCNMITHIKNDPQKLPIKFVDMTKPNPKFAFLNKLKQPELVYLWNADADEEFEYVKLEPFDPKAIEDANKSFASFTPIAPLSIRVSPGCSIVRGKDHSYLYIKQSSLKGSTNLVELVDPWQSGKIEEYDLETFAQSQGDSTSDDVANLIDPDKVEQIIMVCFDRSGSMSWDLQGHYHHDEETPSRVTIATQYLTSFVNKTYSYRIPCILGLIAFNNELEYRCPLSPLIPDFEDKGLKGIEPDGSTKLWDVIIASCDELMKFTRDEKNNPTFEKATKRIIVISDGEDTASESTSDVAAQKLLENKIILDSVIISEVEICKELAVISHISGGVALNAKTINEGMHFFEMSAFQNFKERPKSFKEIIKGNRTTVQSKLKPSQITEQFISDAIKCVEFDTNIKNKNIDDALKVNKLATPDHICSEVALQNIQETRRRRIMRELHYASLVMNKELESYDPDLVIYSYDKNIDRWLVFMKSPEDTPYMGKWFSILVLFTAQYPVEAPIFQFISVPYNLNISDEGRICMDILEKGYIASFHAIDILQQIKSIFLIQSLEYPISIEKMELFRDDHDEYEKKARQSAIDFGKDDYHEFISDKINIKSDVKDDYQSVFDDESSIPPYMKSQISGRVLKDPVIPPSVGVLYERDELKKLIASSKNPTCIVTGLPITETLEQVSQLQSYTKKVQVNP